MKKPIKANSRTNEMTVLESVPLIQAVLVVSCPDAGVPGAPLHQACKNGFFLTSNQTQGSLEY